jgi:hypothetical protein
MNARDIGRIAKGLAGEEIEYYKKINKGVRFENVEETLELIFLCGKMKAMNRKGKYQVDFNNKELRAQVKTYLKGNAFCKFDSILSEGCSNKKTHVSHFLKCLIRIVDDYYGL